MAATTAERCPASGGTQAVEGTVVVDGVERPAWIYGDRKTCTACGQTVRFRVRANDLSPWARVLPHRTDGTPCR